MSKVSELTGAELDWWVALAQGWTIGEDDERWAVWLTGDGGSVDAFDYNPSTSGGLCFDLIKKFNIGIGGAPESLGGWWASSNGIGTFTGSTPNQAICRAVIASVYGDEVNDD